jgi:hypothetical protein
MSNLFGRLAAHATYANVVSTLALVAVLGTGTAYAANTIGSIDVIDGSLLHEDLHPDAVTGDLVADGSLTMLDLSGVDVQTTVSASRLRPGKCVTSTIGVAGARPGQLAVLSPMDKPKKAIVLSAQRVPAADQLEVGVCNVGLKTAKPGAMRVRVVTLD